MAKKAVLSFLAAALAVAVASAAPAPGLRAATFGNGLQAFAFENRAAPLVRIQITFKAGAIAQSKENAGAFRLLDRLLMSGNDLYPDRDSMKAALAELGLERWEGGVSEESVSYYFTIPSSAFSQGLRFLSRAFMSPRLDPVEIESAKASLSAELAAAPSDQAQVYRAAILSRLFPKYPFRRDPAGSPAAIASLGEKALRDIVQTYLVPNNCALVIGGDVDPGQALAAAEAAFGQWPRSADPWKTALPAQPMPPFKRAVWILLEDPSIPEGAGAIEMRYRGPDSRGDPKAATTDPKATYAAEVLMRLLNEADGRFKSDLMKNVPGLVSADGLRSWYELGRDGGQIVFSAAFKTDGTMPAWERAQAHFKEEVRGVELEAIRRDPVAFFGKGAIEAAKAGLADDEALVADSVDGLAGSLSRLWTSGPEAAIAGRGEAIQAIGTEDLRSFLFKYVNKNLELVALRLSPADYARESKAAIEHGFEAVVGEAAFWWKAKK